MRYAFRRVALGIAMRVIDQFEAGAGWIAHPDEFMQRASHILVDDGDVWVVEPVDAAGVDDFIEGFGDVTGVVVLLDRHTRDAETIAQRYEVPVYLPMWLSGVARRLDAPVERVAGALADTGYRIERIVDLPMWREGAIIGKGTLLVADSLGTAEYFRVEPRQLGVHPFLRLLPPRATLHGLRPERVLVGHGAGVFENATMELAEALRIARRSAPKLYVNTLKSFL